MLIESMSGIELAVNDGLGVGSVMPVLRPSAFRISSVVGSTALAGGSIPGKQPWAVVDLYSRCKACSSESAICRL